ncbi:Multicopper oxidase with three cupredoxin domains (includes cell division protein FtsP and spore coat protein CotA) [Bosea lathyri]|uniref:Multicopper oxidase with three cupredoxin domains (Includes cell division protein FtsP and spore coat protein CotA) n=2 Tax=Bosea lathyri TaxID=1036778 RepID=A0A1H5W0B1_9HYPH|nr:Multicopper oxidase with three cupredoxin domains (includes cell division protein FtsP and spore coat protein CotA) [Bosea lathyri]
MPVAMSDLPPEHPALATRRSVLAGLTATAVLLPAGGRAQQAAPARPSANEPPLEPALRTLTAAPAKARLRPTPAPETEIWAFDGTTPGPALRIKQGETLRVKLENKTANPLSLHWHGLRGEAAMDGVGGFSQPPVAPGESFEYRLRPSESGTILYRPFVIGGSSEPAGRGLGGILVVEEPEPPVVDLDLPVLVTDWLLGDDHVIRPFVTASPESAAAGRLGSWVTVNGGSPPQRVAVAPGARVRLRLANGCNARIMRLRFDGVKAVVIAVDGQPTDSFEPVRSQLPFAPGSRYDLIVDMPEEAGATAMVTALVGSGVPLVRLVTEGGRKPAATAPAALKANPSLPAAVRMQDALRPEIVIEGGAKAGPDQKLDLSGLDLERPWRINGGVGAVGSKPLFSARRGTPIVLAIENKTAFFQPMHVHGHCFRLLHPLDDGWEPYFLDTVQIPDGKRLHVAFIAENPGRWLISSTVLERFDLGLWSWFEVT